MIIIETKRTILRTFKETDLEDLHAYYSKEEVGNIAGWNATTKIETKAVLDSYRSNPNALAIEYKENHKVIGHIRINDDTEEGRADTKELGYALHPKYHKRGLMSEVVIAVLEYLFNSNIQNVYACCFQENVASKALIEKCGFVLEQEGTVYTKSLDKTFKSYEYIYTKEMWDKRNKGI